MILLAKCFVVSIARLITRRVDSNLVTATLVKKFHYPIVLHPLLDYVFKNLNVIALLFVRYCLLSQSLLELLYCFHVDLALSYFR